MASAQKRVGSLKARKNDGIKQQQMSKHELENYVISSRWRLVFDFNSIKALGKGAFGEVYLAMDKITNQQVAIKVEAPNQKKAVLKLEVCILKKISGEFACKFISAGKFIDQRVNGQFVYLVMSVSGPKLNVGFRGTARYASLSVHAGADSGRIDDLWSLFYVTIEFLMGSLPWKAKEKDKIGELKLKYTNYNLVSKLPLPVMKLYLYLVNLQFTSEPDYRLIESFFDEMFDLSKMPADIPFDWDMPNPTILRTEDETQIAPSSYNDIPMAAEKSQLTQSGKGDHSFEFLVPK